MILHEGTLSKHRGWLSDLFRSSSKHYVLEDDGSLLSYKIKPTNNTQYGQHSMCLSLHDVCFIGQKLDTKDKNVFAIYTIEETHIFKAENETSMFEWVRKLKECHSSLFKDLKPYYAVFEAKVIGQGHGTKYNLAGKCRIVLRPMSLDLIPMQLAQNQAQLHQQQQMQQHRDHPHHNVHSHHFVHHPHLHRHHHHHHSHTSRYPLGSTSIIEFLLRSIRRVGHAEYRLLVELGRHSSLSDGELWMQLANKDAARDLHEMLLAAMKSSATEEPTYRAPRSRSGSSSENHLRPMQSRSSSLVCLNTLNNAASANGVTSNNATITTANTSTSTSAEATPAGHTRLHHPTPANGIRPEISQLFASNNSSAGSPLPMTIPSTSISDRFSSTTTSTISMDRVRAYSVGARSSLVHGGHYKPLTMAPLSSNLNHTTNSNANSNVNSTIMTSQPHHNLRHGLTLPRLLANTYQKPQQQPQLGVSLLATLAVDNKSPSPVMAKSKLNSISGSPISTTTPTLASSMSTSNAPTTSAIDEDNLDGYLPMA